MVTKVANEDYAILDVEELDQCIINVSRSRSLSEDSIVASKIVMPVYPKLTFKAIRPHQNLAENYSMN